MRRAKGQGSIYQKNGKWVLFCRSQGKRVTKSLGEGTRREAEAKARAFIEVLPVLGVKAAAVKTCGITLKEVWSTFNIRTKNCAEKTTEGYAANWKIFLRWAVAQGLKTTLDIEPEHAAQFGMTLLKRTVTGRLISEDTAHRILKVVRRVLRGVGCQAWLDLPPGPRGASKGRRESFTESELTAIKEVMDDASIGCMFKEEIAVLHCIGLETGLRLGDCCLLKWASIANGVLSLQPRKTAHYARTVSIPVSKALEDALNKALAWRDESGFVLPNLAKRYEKNRCGIQVDYEYLLRKAGIETSIERKGMRAVPRKTFHSLRHTFVSRLAEKGISPLLIQSMSGHSTMLMTERYSHIGIDAKRRALGEEIEPGKVPQASDESATKKKLDAIKTLLESKKDRTPLEEALLGLL